ncbi:MAG: hypothetical protein ACO1SV_04360 [Fimbriimonas sp.]
MQRFATTLAITLGSLALGFSQAPDLAKDERLAKPITVRLKMYPLPDAMKMLTDASGVPLEASVPLKDLKVTILVKDQPAHLVMAKVASTLDLEWEADGASYRIKANDDVANAQRKYLDQEERLRRKKTEDALKKLAAAAAVPFVQAKAKDAQLTPERYLLGQAFRNLAANGWTAFWNGRTVRNAAPLREAAANDPAANPPPPTPGPSDGEAQRRGGQRDRPRRSVRMVRVAAQYDPIQNRLMTFDLGQNLPLPNDENAPGNGLGIWTVPQGELVESTYGKRILAWPRRDDKPEALQKAFTAVEPVSGGWFAGRLSSADVLESLHKASGVPIVADAFRVVATPVRGGANPAVWLTAYGQTNGGFVRTEDGFAMVRHGGFWRLRQLEVPERVAKPLETAKTPSLEDYATFAAALSDVQALVYRRPNLALLKVDAAPLRFGVPALRFYASLGSLQSKARQNQAIPFGTLGAAQRNLFLEAMDGIFEGGATVGRGGDIDITQEANALAFLMTLQEIPTASAGGALSLGTRLLFGVTANDGVAYSIGVPPRS